MSRDPSANPTPFDHASFYIERLKYGPGPHQLEHVGMPEIVGQLETLMRDANVTSMTGHELAHALDFYGESMQRSFGIPRVIALSCFLDGVMHGIAFAGGLRDEAPSDSLEGGQS